MLKGRELNSIPVSTMGEFFFRSARKFEDRICQVDANSNQHETYSELNDRSTRVAIAMMKLGVTHQDVIGTCSTITLDTPVPLLASFYLGAKVANLDPTLSVRQTAHLLALVSPKVIFVEEASVELIEKSLLEAKFDTQIVVFGETTKYMKFSSLEGTQLSDNEFVPQSVDVEDTSIIFFSSGSTGLPKAICHSNRSFLLLAFSFYKSGGTFDTILSFSSFYWISAMIFLVVSFIEGGRRIICGSTVKAEQVFSCIQKHKVTVIFMAPILTYELTNFPDYKKYDLSSVYIVMTGGTPLSSTQFRKVNTVFEHSNIIVMYGLTEVGIVSMFDPKKDKEVIMQKVGSSGKVMLGYTIKIVDVQNGKVLGPNQKGEICIKSATIMKGYYQADSTQMFDNEGFVKTGDVGYYDDDECLYFVDRLKEMFKYLSWHIVPSAIEDVLSEHPEVKEAVVFGLPRKEEEGEVPGACVVLKDNCRANVKEIEDFVASRVSDKERLRGGVYFLKDLTRTATGKVMRKKIRDDVIHILKNKQM